MPSLLRSHIAEPSRAIAPFDTAALADRVARVGPVQLADLARFGARVTIAFTDATRACPDAALIPFVLSELWSLGVRASDVTLLCATGLHRPTTREERLAKLGPPVSSACASSITTPWTRKGWSRSTASTACPS